MHPALRISFVFLFGTLVLVSCKGKKGVTRNSSRKPEPIRTEYRDLSKKLNLEIGEDDNIALYQYIAGWLGTSHKIGGCDRGGIDCSCFIRTLFEQVYRQKLPRTAAEMHQQVKTVNKSELREGDLVFFTIKSSKPSHVGVYLKKGWFAHVSTSKGVMINNLTEPYYNNYYSGAGRNRIP